MSQNPHPLATLAQIINTPSRQDGIPQQVEDDLRVSTIATAQVLLHRFFYVSSLCSFSVTDISISALFLATKLNETPIRLRELINTYIYLSARIQHLLSLPANYPLAACVTDGGAGGARISGTGKGKEREQVWDGMRFEVPGFHDEVFWEWKDAITAGEMQILKRLGFNMQVDLPYNHAINYLKILNLVFEPEVAQLVWSILNDMCLTPAHAIHPPHVLACASILVASRLRSIALPEGWERLFDAEWEDVWSVAGMVMVLWHDWGNAPTLGRGEDAADVRNMSAAGSRATMDGDHRKAQKQDEREKEKEKGNRWRRAWVLCTSRKAVRRWVEETAARDSVGGTPLGITT